MSNTTSDHNHPDLKQGVDDLPVNQNKVYLVLSDEERQKGFVRPIRRTYRHVGEKIEEGTIEPLEEHPNQYHTRENGYVAYLRYQENRYPIVGKYIKQPELTAIKEGAENFGGCGAVTTISLPIAEVYARDPKFYGSTYCCGCHMHRPVSEFVWVSEFVMGDGAEVGS